MRKEIVSAWAIAWPLILNNLLNVSVGVIDLIMVGTLGAVAIASIGMARQVMMLIMVLMIAVNGGTSILISHAFGAGNRQKVSEISARAVVITLFLAVLVIMPIGLFGSHYIMLLLGADAEVVRQGSLYMKILFAGCMFPMFNFALSGILLGVGKTRVSLILLIFINILNVLLNYCFIFGIGSLPAMGVAGAALGSVVARGIGCIAGIWILKTTRLPIQAKLRDGFVLDVLLLRKILHLGGPRSLQGIARNFSRLMSIRIITLMPQATLAVSVYSVGMQVKMIASFVGLAFMASAQSRVGQNLGKKDVAAAEKSGWISAGMATVSMTLIALVFFLFPEWIMSFFTENPDVIHLGATFFMIAAFGEPVMAFSFALSGALRGGGDSISPFIYGSISDLTVVIILGYVLCVTYQMGLSGIALALVLSAFTRAIPTTMKFMQGKWKAASF